MNQRIDARIDALDAAPPELKTMVTTESEGGPAKSDRRGMVKLLAAGAVGAVTGAAILGAQPAAAANNDPVSVGDSLTGTISTDFTITGDSALRLFGDPYGIESDGGVANALFSG